MFLLRGQDKYAHEVVRIYADLIERDSAVNSDHVAAVRIQSNRMRAWSLEHPSTPDVPPDMIVTSYATPE